MPGTVNGRQPKALPQRPSSGPGPGPGAPGGLPQAEGARDAHQSSPAAQHLGTLGRSGSVTRLEQGAWAELGQHLLALDDKAFAQSAGALRAKGLLVQRPRPGLLFASDLSGATALVEPASQRVRLTEPGGGAKLFVAGKVAETISISGSWAIVKQEGKPEARWNLDTGEGQADGKAIAFPKLGLPPGEAPRKPGKWPENRLVEPDFGAYANGKAYAKAYDAAVVQAGGQVLEPLDPPMSDADMAPRYNCHSFATTGGQGDLADPFLNQGQARWLNFPFFQLKEQGFAELSPQVRVRPGDVVLYRNAQGEATHTGVVREVNAEGNPTRVESKWGAFGRYLHGANDVPAIYGEPAQFFRKP